MSHAQQDHEQQQQQTQQQQATSIMNGNEEASGGAGLGESGTPPRLAKSTSLSRSRTSLMTSSASLSNLSQKYDSMLRLTTGDAGGASPSLHDENHFTSSSSTLTATSSASGGGGGGSSGGGGGGGNINALNERVTTLASSVYTELEKIVKSYGRDTVKDLTPIVVNILGLFVLQCHLIDVYLYRIM